MEPTNLRFGGGAAETILHPVVAVAMLVAVLLILIRPRNKAITPFLLAAFTIPMAQVVVIGGIHFPVLRILILTVLARMAFFPSSKGRFTGGFNALDKLVVLWAVLDFTVLCLQWMHPQALIKFVGDLIDTLGGYLSIRFLIPDHSVVRRTIKILALVCVINGAFMVSEQFTQQSVLAFLGAPSPTVRDGKIRSEGVLGTLHGGTLAAVLLPMFLWLWGERKARTAAFAGITGATAMVWASHASTSWLAYAAAVVGLCYWPLRNQMRLVRWGLVGTLIGLHLVMHGPVWSLIEKIDVTGGSSSYHRYMLVDNCLRHLSDWWLLGYKDYGIWGFDMWDLCNQFVSVALTGGLISLGIYIAIFSRSFGMIGTARKRVAGDRRQEWLLWCFGSVLFAHVVAYFGINCTVQLLLIFFALLVWISVAVREGQLAPQSAEAPDKLQFAAAALQ